MALCLALTRLNLPMARFSFTDATSIAVEPYTRKPMTPSKDYRAGDITVRLKRPGWTKPGSIYIQVQQDGGPKSYSNIVEMGNLPLHVKASLEETGVAYWDVKVGDGKIQFKKQTTIGGWKMDHDTFVFDEDGDVQYDVLVDRLIDKCELDLREPDKQRFNGLDDEQWAEVKNRAHEQINGRG
jgi:hypothetical protein